MFEVFAFVALQEAVFHHDFVGEEQVNTSGQGVLVGVFLGGVALDVGIREVVGDVGIKDGGAQYAYGFAFHTCRGRLDAATFGANEDAGIGVIRVGERDAFAAFRGVVHGGNDGVDFVRF